MLIVGFGAEWPRGSHNVTEIADIFGASRSTVYQPSIGSGADGDDETSARLS